MLREVRVTDIVSPLDTTSGWFFISEEHFDQCRLAGTIRSDEADTITAFNIQIEIFKQNLVIKALAEVVQCKDIPANAAGALFIHLGSHPAGVHKDALNLVHPFNASLRDFTDLTLGVTTALVALNQVLEALDFLLLLLPLLVLTVQTFLFLLAELGVVAAVESEFAIVEVGNRIDDGIQECTVVADKNDRTQILFEEGFKPLNGFDVGYATFCL